MGWSTQHGDLRIPHFFGLHGLQLLPFFGWLILRGKTIESARNQTRMAFAATASYVSFIGILTWQALRGQSVIAPDSTTLVAMAVWLTMTILAGVILTRHAPLPARAFATWRTTKLCNSSAPAEISRRLAADDGTPAISSE